MNPERGSSKHGPRLDEEMAREVEGEITGRPGGRAEEWREPEPAADGEPDAEWAPPGHIAEPTGDDRDPDYRDHRARIGTYISLTEFPATGARILSEARNHNAPQDVLEVLGRLNMAHRYANSQELWKSLHLSSGPRF
jgi:hypothetical protein